MLSHAAVDKNGNSRRGIALAVRDNDFKHCMFRIAQIGECNAHLKARAAPISDMGEIT